MPESYNALQAVEFGTLVTLVGREGRGQSYDAMLGIAWSVRNRVLRPRYWGHDWMSVMSHPEAYSSMVPPRQDNDPNLRVWADLTNKAWMLVLEASEAAYGGVGTDPVAGATHYYDASLDSDPPYWAKDGSATHVCDIDALRFWIAN